MKPIKSKVLKYSIFFLLLFSTTGCQNQTTEVQKIDDTRYIVDQQMILILCEAPDAGSEYIDILNSLKGNGDEVLAAIEQLEGLEQTVPVQNAIGVGKNLLRKPDEAEVYFQRALETVENPTDKAIVLSNLAESKYYQKQYIKQYDEALSVMNQAVEEYQNVNTDMVLSMVLESNQIRLAMMEEYPQLVAKYALKIKELLKKEKKQFGANQFIGMFNLQSMALVCHYDDEKIERSLEYMEKAVDINHQWYQYTFFDIRTYNLISDMFYYEPDSMEKGLEYENKCIELLDEWQSDWHYDRLQIYTKRGQSYYSMGELEKSSEDYNLVLEQSRDETDIVSISYYYLGQIDLMQRNVPEKALDYYFKAYCIWQRYDRPSSLQTIKQSIENVYYRYGYENENPDFEDWFVENIEKTKKEMKDEERYS